MKPAKKQTKPKAGKDRVGGTPMEGIASFFKPVAKSFAIDKNHSGTKTDNGDKMFYVTVLKEKLRKNAEQHIGEKSEVATDERAKVDNETAVPEPQPADSFATDVPVSSCSECVQKDLAIMEYKVNYAKQSIHFSELYSKYNDLLKTVKSINAPPAVASAASSSDMFTERELVMLQCMDSAKNNDCSFIHHCLKYEYKDNLSVMASKTLWGTAASTVSKNGEQMERPAKDTLTPEKVRRIKADRMKEPYVHRLLYAGIKNIAKKYKQADDRDDEID